MVYQLKQKQDMASVTILFKGDILAVATQHKEDYAILAQRLITIKQRAPN